MTKLDKKNDKQLIKLLTKICEQHKDVVAGFSWLTHIDNINKANDRLRVICVFDNNQQLAAAHQQLQTELMSKQIINVVASLGYKVNNKKLVQFDSEENCQASHNGNWQLRLSASIH